MDQKVVSITMEATRVIVDVDPAPSGYVTFNVSRVDSFEMDEDVLTLQRSSITTMGDTGLCMITWSEIYTRVVRVELSE